MQPKNRAATYAFADIHVRIAVPCTCASMSHVRFRHGTGTLLASREGF